MATIWPNGTWSTQSDPGDQFAACLVMSTYNARNPLEDLPREGQDGVEAVQLASPTRQ